MVEVHLLEEDIEFSQESKKYSLTTSEVSETVDGGSDSVASDSLSGSRINNKFS